MSISFNHPRAVCQRVLRRIKVKDSNNNETHFRVKPIVSRSPLETEFGRLTDLIRSDSIR